MSRFKVGDRVKIRTSGRTGTVRIVYEGQNWGFTVEDEYSIEFDDGTGAMTLVERIIEPLESIGFYEVKCECGSKYSSFETIHSYWCPVYKEPGS